MLIITLLYTSSPALAGERLDTVVRPVAQAIDLRIDPAKTTFDGRTTITFTVPSREKVETVPLHGEGLTIRDASLARVAGWRRHRDFSVEVTTREPDRLVVTPEIALRAGTYELTFDYEGPLHEQSYGLYRFDHDGRPYVISQLEADEARTAWPCFDEPSYKIPWTLSIEHPPDTVAISNSPIVRTRPAGNNRVEQYATTPPMPSYAVAVAVGPYAATPVAGMKVPSKVWTSRGQEALAPSAARDLPAVVGWLEGWFGEPYPYEKLDLIATPKFSYGAMENPGAIVYTEGLFFTEATATPSREQRLVEVTAHEVAHMWFGNLVTLAWWDDLWLNESFASFMGVHVLDALRPDARQDVARVGRLTGMLSMDGGPTARPVRTEVNGSAVFETTNFAAYGKGEALLDMLEQWLGEEKFRNGIRTYIARHRWGNATFQDLVEALEDVSGEPVQNMLSGYLDRPGAPRVAVTTSGDEGITLTQSRFRRLGVELPDALWDVPLRLRVGREDGTTEVVRVRLSGESETVSLGDDVAWVHPAADGLGYWVWTLDEPAMGRLLDARDALSPAERRSIWSSLSLGLASGELEAADVLRAAETFAEEPDPSIRRAILGATDMTGTIEQLDDEELLERWHAWQRRQWRPWLEALGERSEDESSEMRELRERLLGLLSEAGDEAVRKELTALGHQGLEDPSSVPYDLLDEALGVLAEDGDLALYDKLVAMADATTELTLQRKFLGAAASIPDGEVRTRVLARALAPETTAGELFTLVRGVRWSGKADTKDLIVDWTMEHYDAIAEKLPPQGRMNLARTGRGCDLERFERTVAFFTDDRRNVEGTERALAETRAGVEQCLRRVEAREPSLRAFLTPETANR